MKDHEVIAFLRRKRDWEKGEEKWRRRHLRMLGWCMLFAIPVWALITAAIWFRFFRY